MVKRQNALLRFLSSGKFKDLKDESHMEEMVRYVLYNVALIAGGVFLFIFGATVIMGGSILRGMLDISVGLMCVVVIFLLRTKVPFIVSGFIPLLPFGILCALLVLSGGERGFAGLWVYSYPMLTIFILGLYAGSILSALLLAGIMTSTLIPGLAQYSYTTSIALRYIAVYVMVAVLAIVYEQIRIYKDRWVRQLTAALHVERDLITAMKDNLKSGLFLMNKDYVIQGSYSKPLEAILGTDKIEGKKFIDFLGASLKANERDTLEDYFSMVLNRSFDANMLDDINPISEFTYVNEPDNTFKILQTNFATVDQGHGEYFVLGTLEDVTEARKLEQQLAEEAGKREEEMRALFQVIQVEPRVFGDFIEDMEYEFDRINTILKNKEMSAKEAMIDIYQSVHAIKSNALILGLENFSGKLHELENTIKKYRDQPEVVFADVLHVTVGLETIMKEKDKFQDTIGKIKAFQVHTGGNRRQDRYVLIQTLTKACEKASAALEKKTNFVVEDLDGAVLETGPRRVIKEVLTQLVRNSVYHGIEIPEEREAAGKNREGTIRLSIKQKNGTIHLKLSDDGKGLDFAKIREKALNLKLLQKKEDAENKNELLQVIFSPGFSTVDSADMHAGRGIGLNLVRERIRDLHGSIKLSSKPGEGTTFNIYIPLESKTTEKVS
jgi:two-component system chemotaxis sensor kinase CheA